ncbi:recombinase family protein [[Actinomadura] parvosata]|uniref:recombinase family protein n=1 Tax=[Actinomadura] parvosata TaxID=1955412 RepID=UPI00406BFC0E
MNVIIYARQSQDRLGEELGVTRQREDAETLARLRGWTVVRVIVDNDASAAGKKPRKGFEELLEALQRGAAQAVIAWDWTRLERNRRDGLRLMEIGEKMTVTLAFVRGSDIDLSTPAGRLVADMMSSVARHEIDQKSDRQRRAVLQAAQEGRRVGGRKPFGYAADGVTILRNEAQAIQDGYDLLLAGAKLEEIAREWNRRGFSGQVRDWKWDSVRNVLRNPRYAGLRAHNGEIMAPAEWKELVSEETWRAAQDILDKRAAVVTPRGAKRLLTALARDAACGATVHAGGAFGGYPMYRCSAYTKLPGGKAPDVGRHHVSRKALPVEAYVVGLVLERLSRTDAVDLLLDRQRPDAEKLRREASALRTRLEGLAVDYADGTLTKAQVRAASERINTRLLEVEAQMADAGRVDILAPLISADDKWAMWGTLTMGRQRLVIDTLLEIRLEAPGRGTRTFRPETVLHEWK